MPKGKSRAAYRNSPYNIPADERELAYQEYQVQRYKENLEAAKKLPEFLTEAKLKLFHVNAHMSLLDFAKIASKFRLDANRFKNSMAEPARYMQLQVNDIREMLPLALVPIPSKHELCQKRKRKTLHDCTGDFIHDFMKILTDCGLIVKILGEKKHLRMYEYVYDPAILVTYLSKLEVAEPTEEEFWHAWSPNTKRKIEIRNRMHAWECKVCDAMLALEEKRKAEAEAAAQAKAALVTKVHARGAQLESSKSREFFLDVANPPPIEKILDIPPAMYEGITVTKSEEVTESPIEQKLNLILDNQKLILANQSDLKEAVAHAFYGSGPHPSWITLPPSSKPDTL